MKKALILLVLIIASAAVCYAGSVMYLLTNSDVRTLTGHFQYALEHNQARQAADWINPVTGLRGSTIPIKTYVVGQGQYCRDYLASVQLDGTTQQAFGTACRLPDGHWKIVAEKPVTRNAGQMKFVFAGRQQSSCPHALQKPSRQQLDAERLPDYIDPHHEFFSSRAKRYHSDSFYRQLERMKRKARPEVSPRDEVKPPPSKLVKLVDYRPATEPF